MIRTWIALVPNDHRARLIGFALLAFCSVVARAVGTVLLVPLMAALFGEAPQRAWLWLGWLSAATVAGWVLDAVTARIGIELGFAVLNHTQHDVADRLPVVGWIGLPPKTPRRHGRRSRPPGRNLLAWWLIW